MCLCHMRLENFNDNTKIYHVNYWGYIWYGTKQEKLFWNSRFSANWMRNIIRTGKLKVMLYFEVNEMCLFLFLFSFEFSALYSSHLKIKKLAISIFFVPYPPIYNPDYYQTNFYYCNKYWIYAFHTFFIGQGIYLCKNFFCNHIGGFWDRPLASIT